MSTKLETNYPETKSFARGAFNREDPTEFLLGNIHSERKDQGGGGRVLRAIEDLAKQHGAKRIHAVLGDYPDTNLEALKKFYTRHGYTLYEDDDGVIHAAKNL